MSKWVWLLIGWAIGSFFGLSSVMGMFGGGAKAKAA